MRRVLLACALALLASCARASSAEDEIDEQWQALEINAEAVDLGVERAGRLVFRGGLALSGEREYFGGLSGLEVLDGGAFLAISDTANWYEGRLVLDEAGALIGVASVRKAAMRGTDAEPYDARAVSDSEGLTQLVDGRFAVSFEQTPRVMIYDFNRDGPFGAARNGPTLAGTAALPPNASLEALTVDAQGRLIVGAEGGGGATPIWRVPLDARGPTEPLSAYPLGLGYSLTALDRAPDDSGIFALERFYAPIIGARARIVFIPAASLDEPGAVLAGLQELATLAPPMPVDNFEAIAATRNADGGIRLYILSDDNFNDRQRTLLYAFDVVSEDEAR